MLNIVKYKNGHYHGKCNLCGKRVICMTPTRKYCPDCRQMHAYKREKLFEEKKKNEHKKRK